GIGGEWGVGPAAAQQDGLVDRDGHAERGAITRSPVVAAGATEAVGHQAADRVGVGPSKVLGIDVANNAREPSWSRDVVVKRAGSTAASSPAMSPSSGTPGSTSRRSAVRAAAQAESRMPWR